MSFSYVAVILGGMLGLGTGSFLNVVIDRGARGETLRGRSRCESCNKKLSVKELLPIFSFLIQKGRCRNCGAALSWQYPLVELATAVFYAISVWFFLPSYQTGVGLLVSGLGAFLVIATSIVIFVSDLKYEIIPDGAFLILLAVGLMVSAWRFYGGSGLVEISYHIATSIFLSLFLASLWFISRGQWMGLGDAKLILATSFMIGFPLSLVSFLFSFWLGGITGIALILTGQKTLKNDIPFGPFILIATLLAYFFGQDFIIFSGLNNLTL